MRAAQSGAQIVLWTGHVALGDGGGVVNGDSRVAAPALGRRIRRACEIASFLGESQAPFSVGVAFGLLFKSSYSRDRVKRNYPMALRARAAKTRPAGVSNHVRQSWHVIRGSLNSIRVTCGNPSTQKQKDGPTSRHSLVEHRPAEVSHNMR